MLQNVFLAGAKELPRVILGFYKMWHKIAAGIALFLAGAAACSGRADEPKLMRFEFTEPHIAFDLFASCFLPRARPRPKRLPELLSASHYRRLDNHLSDYKPTSELMQLCQKAGGPPVPVGEDLRRVLEYAQTVSRLSDGAFDVSVGPLTKLWRLARRTHQMPDKDKLASARALVGYKNIRLDAKNRTVQLMKPGMQLDLGGIAKGYSGDAVLETLAKMAVTSIAAGCRRRHHRGRRSRPEPRGGRLASPNSKTLRKRQAVFSCPPIRPSRPPAMRSNMYVEIAGKRYSAHSGPALGLGLVGRMSGSRGCPSRHPVGQP